MQNKEIGFIYKSFHNIMVGIARQIIKTNKIQTAEDWIKFEDYNCL